MDVAPPARTNEALDSRPGGDASSCDLSCFAFIFLSLVYVFSPQRRGVRIN